MGLLSLEHGKGAERADFLLYGLAIGALALVLGWRSPPAQAGALAATAALGVAAWTLIEYGVHRLVLHHVPPFKGWHARHHSQPRALIGLPTLLSATLFAVFVYVPAWAWAGGWPATAFTLGVLAGYLAYAAVHHAVHHTHAPGPWLRQRRRWHALHHRPGGGDMAFGVTSGLWDRVFRSTGLTGGRQSAIPPAPVPASPGPARSTPVPAVAGTPRVALQDMAGSGARASAAPLARPSARLCQAPPPGDRHVLTLNCGASSLTFGLYRVDVGADPASGPAGMTCLVCGHADGLGSATPSFQAQGDRGRILLREAGAPAGVGDAVQRIARLLADSRLPAPDAVGHRIVHGGPGLQRHCLVDAQVLQDLACAAALAPRHAAAALSAIGSARAQFPGLPQVACLGAMHGQDRNRPGARAVTRDAAAGVVQMLPMREDEHVARQTWALCGLATPHQPPGRMATDLPCTAMPHAARMQA